MLNTALWTILIVLLLGWIFGFAVANLGAMVHVLLVFAIILLMYNLFAASTSERRLTH